MDEKLRRSRKQERRGAEMFGGTMNAGSGNGSRKGDVRTDDENIEFKTTIGKSYSLKHRDLEDAYRNALLIGRRALFGVEFSDGRTSDRYIVLTEADYLAMKDAWSSV